VSTTEPHTAGAPAPHAAGAPEPHAAGAAAPLFRSFFLAGFECSSHRLRTGRRLDVLASSGHERHLAADYRRLREVGLLTAREGLRWHRVEREPGRYDWSSVLPMVRCARESGIQVIWDLFHYGWPDDLDVFRPEFVTRLARLARAFAALLRDEGDEPPFVSPVNEISFVAWASGSVAYMNPFARGRGDELKVQLVRAAVECVHEIRDVSPGARFMHPDPLIHVVASPKRPWERPAAARHRQAQYESWDMLSGRAWPWLGGGPDVLDVVGVNYYADNQWVHRGRHITRFHPMYRPLRHLLIDVHQRYGRPILIAETGIEGDERPEWLRYVGREARAAMRAGAAIEGICLYPVVAYPGWDDDRVCHSGLWGPADAAGRRTIHAPLAAELRRQQRAFAAVRRSPTLAAATAPGGVRRPLAAAGAEAAGGSRAAAAPWSP
jgi:hypothetical protein